MDCKRKIGVVMMEDPNKDLLIVDFVVVEIVEYFDDYLRCHGSSSKECSSQCFWALDLARPWLSPLARSVKRLTLAKFIMSIPPELGCTWDIYAETGEILL